MANKLGIAGILIVLFSAIATYLVDRRDQNFTREHLGARILPDHKPDAFGL